MDTNWPNVDYSRVLKAKNEQIVEYEAQIKVMRDALKELACLGNGDKHGNSIGNSIAIKALSQSSPLAALAQKSEPKLLGYVVQTADEHFVGIWQDRKIAEIVVAKQPPSHEDKVVVAYTSPPNTFTKEDVREMLICAVDDAIRQVSDPYERPSYDVCQAIVDGVLGEKG